MWTCMCAETSRHRSVFFAFKAMQSLRGRVRWTQKTGHVILWVVMKWAKKRVFFSNMRVSSKNIFHVAMESRIKFFAMQIQRQDLARTVSFFGSLTSWRNYLLNVPRVYLLALEEDKRAFCDLLQVGVLIFFSCLASKTFSYFQKRARKWRLNHVCI